MLCTTSDASEIYTLASAWPGVIPGFSGFRFSPPTPPTPVTKKQPYEDALEILSTKNSSHRHLQAHLHAQTRH